MGAHAAGACYKKRNKVKGQRDKDQGYKDNFEFLILNFELKAKDKGSRNKVQGKRGRCAYRLAVR
jgi:hypothetical protein